MISCFLIITTLVGHFFYLYFLDKKHPSLALLFKTIAAFSFVMIGIIQLNIPPEKFKTWFVYALIFDAIGDVLLGIRNILPNSLMFECGAMSFLLGHFLFLNGLLPQVNKLLCMMVTLGIIVGYYILYLRKLDISIKKKIFTIIYVYSILLISVSGIYYFNSTHSFNSYIRMMGSILFACSDLLLIDYNFRKKAKIKHSVYSFLYFLGQILIGLSLG